MCFGCRLHWVDIEQGMGHGFFLFTTSGHRAEHVVGVNKDVECRQIIFCMQLAFHKREAFQQWYYGYLSASWHLETLWQLPWQTLAAFGKWKRAARDWISTMCDLFGPFQPMCQRVFCGKAVRCFSMPGPTWKINSPWAFCGAALWMFWGSQGCLWEYEKNNASFCILKSKKSVQHVMRTSFTSNAKIFTFWPSFTTWGIRCGN